MTIYTRSRMRGVSPEVLRELLENIRRYRGEYIDREMDENDEIDNRQAYETLHSITGESFRVPVYRDIDSAHKHKKKKITNWEKEFE